MAPSDDSPRHATPKPARKTWDPRPLLADLKAGVQAQLARADTPDGGLAPEHHPEATVSQPTVDAGLSDPAGADDARVGGAALVHAPAPATTEDSRERKQLRRAAEAAEAAAAQAAGAASQAAITAERAMSAAQAARDDAAAAGSTAATVVGELHAAREEVSALHEELLAARAGARRNLIVAWCGIAVALATAVGALVPHLPIG